MSHSRDLNTVLKLLIAALSGFLVALFLLAFVNLEWSPVVGEYLGYIVVSCISGLLFAAGVLSPYISHRDLLNWRSLAIVLMCGASFYCAAKTTTELSTWFYNPDLEDYVIGSLVGAAIVLSAVTMIRCYKYSHKLAIVGFVGAIAGGWLFNFLEDAFRYSEVLAFGGWHLLMAVTLHFARPTAIEAK